MAKKKSTTPADGAVAALNEGLKAVYSSHLLNPLVREVWLVRDERSLCPPEGWALVTSNGCVHVHPTRRAKPDEWVYVIAHCLLHLGFGHFQKRDNPLDWNAACDLTVARFLAQLRIGLPPEGIEVFSNPIEGSEERLYRRFRERGVPPEYERLGTAGPGRLDMVIQPTTASLHCIPTAWQKLLAEGIAWAVSDAVEHVAAGGLRTESETRVVTPLQRARRWFMSNYPLLGALAAEIDLIEDRILCARQDISVAAVNPDLREIYFNPTRGLGQQDYRFILAHELLHVGLNHGARCRGRDFFLWNVACDYVINGWLVEMRVGQLPDVGGVLYDPGLKGLSAEAIYDRMVTEMRRYRKLATLRGVSVGDIIQGEKGSGRGSGAGGKGGRDGRDADAVDLDEFYRGCLAQGLEYHFEQGRGYLPAGLVEEIRALSQPPIPWDVELAGWFDEHFPHLEKRRTYARPSRRQSATPDIPRPSWVPVHGAQDGRTYGVVLDTSGSMPRYLLAKALGAIASYSMSRDVPLVRVVFCDATHYDQGYMAPEAIADKVKVRGRGGTILQPAINLLDKAADFPKDGPLLIITDGKCDKLAISREHAFLMPRGRHLPFVPKGKVFFME